MADPKNTTMRNSMYTKNTYLAHYGVKGMKWGVRKSDYKTSGGVMRKGSAVSRTVLSPEDPNYGNRKYVSTNEEDHKAWEDYLGNAYLSRGQGTYNLMYRTTRDIKIASNAEAGKIFAEKFLKNPNVSKQSVSDTKAAYEALMRKQMPKNISPEEQASFNIAMQTKTGKAFVDSLLKSGYGGVADTHGQNTSSDPVIIFEPEKNLKKVGVDVTEAVKRTWENAGQSRELTEAEQAYYRKRAGIQ